MDIPGLAGGGAGMDVGGRSGSRPLWYSSPGISFLALSHTAEKTIFYTIHATTHSILLATSHMLTTTSIL